MNRLNLATENLTLVVFTAMTALVCGYFVFAATYGPYGLYEKSRIEARETVLSQQHLDIIAHRQAAENRTLRLSDRYLDLDLLDEQSRKLLGMVRDDEIIVE